MQICKRAVLSSRNSYQLRLRLVRWILAEVSENDSRGVSQKKLTRQLTSPILLLLLASGRGDPTAHQDDTATERKSDVAARRNISESSHTLHGSTDRALGTQTFECSSYSFVLPTGEALKRYASDAVAAFILVSFALGQGSLSSCIDFSVPASKHTWGGPLRCWIRQGWPALAVAAWENYAKEDNHSKITAVRLAASS